MTDKLLFLFAAAGLCFSLRAWFSYHAAVKAEKLQKLFDSMESFR